MADPRFFRPPQALRLADAARIASARIDGTPNPDSLIRDVAPLDRAGAEHLTFIDNVRYLPQFRTTRAGFCIAAPEHRDKAPEGLVLLLSDDPYRGYARIAQHLYPEPQVEAGVHPTAVVASSSRLAEGVEIGPYAVVGPAVSVGAGTRIKAHAVLEEGVQVGAGCTIGNSVSLSHCIVGDNCTLHDGARIGTRGFGFAMHPEGHVDVPQLGRVVIEDSVEIGANSTVDRGAGPDTVIGKGSKIDNLVQIGHNVRLGRGCVLVAQSGVAGSSELEDFVAVAAQGGIAGHLRIGRGAQVGAQSGVMRDIPAGTAVMGSPAMPAKQFFRLVSNWRKLLKAKGR